MLAVLAAVSRTFGNEKKRCLRACEGGLLCEFLRMSETKIRPRQSELLLVPVEVLLLVLPSWLKPHTLRCDTHGLRVCVFGTVVRACPAPFRIPHSAQSWANIRGFLFLSFLRAVRNNAHCHGELCICIHGDYYEDNDDDDVVELSTRWGHVT